MAPAWKEGQRGPMALGPPGGAPGGRGHAPQGFYEPPPSRGMEVSMRKKRSMGLLLAGALLLGDMATASAEHYEGDPDWSVSFTGDRMESNFRTSDINDAIYGLQPGDSIDIQLALKNSSSAAADWWMANKVLRSLEDTQEAAASGGYAYTLAYQPPHGERETLYDSGTVGGEKEGTDAGEGLHEATDSLSEYFYLDTLDASEEGRIYLTVALDGETQGNAYQDTLADLTLNFAVEGSRTPDRPVRPGATPEPSPAPGMPPTPVGDRGPDPEGIRPPKTGDEGDLVRYASISLASGLGLLALALYGLWRPRAEKGGEEG